MKAHVSSLAAALLRAVAVLLLTASPLAFGLSTGVTGVTSLGSGTGCNSCHGGAGNLASVVITGPTTLVPGAAGVYTVTATQAVAAAGVKMGMDVAASDAGSLSATGSNTVLQAGEVTHTTPNGSLHVTAGGSANYTFTYTMPAGAAVGSTHTLAAAAVLGFAGPGSRLAANFTVTTIPANPTTLNSSNVTAASADLTWSGGGPTYRLVYKTGAVAPTTPTDGTQVNLGAVTTTNVAGLTANTQYTFKVYSKDAGSTTFSANGPTTTFTTLNVGAAARYVNVATGANTGNCSNSGTPCKTITYAMAQAVAGNPGDQINVAPGTYNLAAGEVFPIAFKSGVRLVATGNPSNTIIDAAGDTVKQGIINAISNNSAQARVEGFTFTNGLKAELTSCGSPLGGALYISSGSGTFTVTRNVFKNNESRGYSPDGSGGFTGCLAWGGALAVFSTTVNVSNNVFVGNIARGGNGFSHPGTPATTNEYGGQAQGGAIYFGGSGSIINNTFHGNSAIGGNGGITSTGPGFGGPGTGGAIVATGNPAPSVVNNILAANAATSGTGAADLSSPSSAGALIVNVGVSPSVTKNLLFGNLVNGAASTGDTPGTSPVSGDPLFHAAPTNLHITPSSPAAGTGTATGAPALDHDGVTRPNPPAIGAYEPTSAAPPNPPRMLNISTRMQVLTGNDVMIGGFVIGGSANKTVAIVATGPSLAAFGIQNPLADPTLTLVRSSDQATLATNDNWQTAANQAQLTAAGFAPSNPLESAILVSLAPGAYTAIVQGVGGGTGVGVVAVYEVDGPTIPLINISTRGRVLTGNDVMIGGFVITGSGPQTVAIVATGPSLAAFGIQNPLADPTIQLVRSSDQVVIDTNDNWQTHANQATLQSAGFAPTNPLESGIYTTLQPGAYTVILSGVGGGIGVGVVGVYKVN